MANRASETIDLRAGYTWRLPEDHFRVRRDPISWPKGARLALTWSVDYEDYTDVASVAEIHDYAYGGKQGIWRLMDIFDGYDVKLSLYINGLTAQRYPDSIRELKRRGHEIVAHGWANNLHFDDYDPDTERDLIRQTFQTFESITGERSQGWLCPGWRTSLHTLEFLVEEGIIWNGDFPVDDLPYTLEVKGKRIVIIPYIRESNDIAITKFNRQLPKVWLECFKAQLDALYREGAQAPMMMNADLHTYIYGRPFGAGVVDEAIRYARRFPDIWWTTRTEIARWWLSQGYD